MGFGLGGIGFEEVVADIGAGEIKVGADLFQQAGAGEEAFADFVVAVLDLAEAADVIEAGKG